MGIVVITMPGESKRSLVQALSQATGGRVDLVIIQNVQPKVRKGLLFRLNEIWRHPSHIKHLWYSVLLRCAPMLRSKLKYFREFSSYPKEDGYTAPVVFVDDINSDTAYEAIRKAQPDLVVVRGSRILSPRLISAAPKVINLHMGYCPYYRGTLANQCAVLDGAYEHIGATIHYVAEKVDAGDVIEIVTPDLRLPPQELFRKLNDDAMRALVSVAKRILQGEDLPSTQQVFGGGKNLLLRQWTPELRWKTALRLLAWERNGIPMKRAF